MAQHLVFTCDWCGADVPAKSNEADAGNFSAKVTVEVSLALCVPETKSWDVCSRCRAALDALTEGKYRRGQ